MTDADKSYWLRKRGSNNQPGQKHGLLLGRTIARRKSVWTIKPAIACAYVGGKLLDAHLERNPDQEAVEVVKKGVKPYHGRTVENWVPVTTNEESVK